MSTLERARPPPASPQVRAPSSVSTQRAPGGIRTPNLLIRRTVRGAQAAPCCSPGTCTVPHAKPFRPMLTMPDEAGVSTSVSKILVPSAGSLVEGAASEHSSAEECGLTARPVLRVGINHPPELQPCAKAEADHGQRCRRSD